MVTRSATSALLLTLCLTLLGCSDEPAGYRYLGDHPVLSVDATVIDDRLHLVWVEQPENGVARARHRYSRDGGNHWSDTVTIETALAPPDRVRRDNDLRVRGHADELLVLWQARGQGFRGAGPMQLAQSSDQGRSWQASTAPAADTDAPAHGFFALERYGDGYHMAWLDNRTGQQGLHYARRDPQGHWSDTETVAEATCQCCWNSLSDDGERVWLLYRALDPRDLSLARRQDQRWQREGAVVDFQWAIDGCPHVGGALVYTGGARPHALTWTGDRYHQGLYHVTPDGDRQRLGGRDARNSDLIQSTDGQLLAVWDEAGRGIQAQWLGAGDGPMTLSHSPQRRPSHPIALDTSSGPRALWTEQRPNGQRTWVLAPIPTQ